MIKGTAVKKPVTIEYRIAEKEEIIKTLEGDMKASVGDYIITGIKGEEYPCKPDIFLETYEGMAGYDDNKKVKVVKSKETIFIKKIDDCIKHYKSIDCINYPYILLDEIKGYLQSRIDKREEKKEGLFKGGS